MLSQSSGLSSTRLARLKATSFAFTPGLKRSTWEPLSPGRAVGEEEDGVVGARVTVDADAIERLLRGLAEETLGVARVEIGVGERRRVAGLDL